MNKTEIMAIDQFVKTIINNSSRCRTCVLNHKGVCYFGVKCVTTDFSCYKSQSSMEEIQKIIKEKENDK